jgi:hypothetical protein
VGVDGDFGQGGVEPGAGFGGEREGGGVGKRHGAIPERELKKGGGRKMTERDRKILVKK